VKAAAVKLREIPDETGGFGSLSFLTKVDISAPQEGRIKKLFFREGDRVGEDQPVLLLENPQIDLAVQRAENNMTQAKAARDLARSRLLEGQFQAEAQLLELEKNEAELDQARKNLEENKRKHLNQETIFAAGGLQEEAIRTGRFSLETEAERILIMEKELDIRRIGCRDRDLAAAGIPVPLDEEGRRRALISLLTSSLAAELKAASARLEAAGKELESAQLALSELLVRSPAPGIVGARYFEEGERVKIEDKILTLMDTASLYAIFSVREKDALRIERGMPAKVELDGSGEVRESLVDLVYPQADSQSMSFMVRVLLINKEEDSENSCSLKPGMFARVKVSLGPPRQIVVVPESSIFNKKNSEGTVFVINGKTVSERKVGLGLALGDEREISFGLNKGELAVLRPEPDLKEGSHVFAAN
jgi:multidrug efflux pump subunit AcrA (membrane-fusion protein)